MDAKKHTTISVSKQLIERIKKHIDEGTIFIRRPSDFLHLAAEEKLKELERGKTAKEAKLEEIITKMELLEGKIWELIKKKGE